MSYAGLLLLAQLVAPMFRAEQAVAQGLADLERAIAEAPEWKHQGGGPSGHGYISAERAGLQGMYDHVVRARQRSPWWGKLIHEPRTDGD